MITEHDLAEAIAECEGQRNPNANTCMKLAAFYTIRDKMYPAKQERDEEMIMKDQRSYYSRSSGSVKSDTEFMQAVDGMELDEILPIIDDLMNAVKVIVPKLYEGVMRRLGQ